MKEIKTTENILSCPFCGKTPDLYEITLEKTERVYYAVRCNCDCMMHDKPECGQAWRDQKDAIAAWNERGGDQDGNI